MGPMQAALFSGWNPCWPHILLQAGTPFIPRTSRYGPRVGCLTGPQLSAELGPIWALCGHVCRVATVWYVCFILLVKGTCEASIFDSKTNLKKYSIRFGSEPIDSKVFESIGSLNIKCHTSRLAGVNSTQYSMSFVSDITRCGLYCGIVACSAPSGGLSHQQITLPAC